MTGPLPPVLGNALPDFSLSGDQMGKIGNHSAQDTFFQRRWGEGGPGAPREEKGSRQLGRCRALPADIGLGPGHPAPPARRGRALDSGGDEPASVRASQLLHILEGEGDGPRGGSSGVTPCTSFCRHTGTQLCPRTRIRTAGPQAGHGHRGAVVALTRRPEVAVSRGTSLQQL